MARDGLDRERRKHPASEETTDVEPGRVFGHRAEIAACALGISIICGLSRAGGKGLPKAGSLTLRLAERRKLRRRPRRTRPSTPLPTK